MSHADVRANLYDFICGELSPQQRTTIEEHLASCGDCRREADVLASLLSDFPREVRSPGNDRPETYWHIFAPRIEEKLTQDRRRRRLSDWASIRFNWPLLSGRRPSVALVGAVSAIVLSIGLWLTSGPPSGEAPQGDAVVPVMGVSSRQTVEEYFTASRMLLIGIANMSPEEGQPIDLTLERTTARTLVRQARLLADEPVDERSQELLGELERILIELANLEESADVPGIELIRTGVRQQNLLFKIRMAEDRIAQ